MKDGKLFAMFFNGSPRKGWNTHKMLESARAGAEEAGAATELVNLYDIAFTGCKSCFACKLKDAATHGVCALRDDLRPVLERAREADVIVLGSPVYFSNTTGEYRSFFERLVFPVFSYHMEENGLPRCDREKVIETANIFTMGFDAEGMARMGYPAVLGTNTQALEIVFGACETLCACDTYQFADYSRYDVNVVSEADKRAHRDAFFATDLANARDLGRRLVERARTHLPQTAAPVPAQ